jgi:hypothetical protein
MPCNNSSKGLKISKTTLAWVYNAKAFEQNCTTLENKSHSLVLRRDSSIGCIYYQKTRMIDAIVESLMSQKIING